VSETRLSIRHRLDRFGVLLSGLCLVHCVASIVLVSVLGLGSMAFLSPVVHKVGLAVALLIAAVTIGLGALQHRRPKPFVTAMTGLTFMGGALAVGHGVEEAVLTILGVILVAAAHIMNLRARR
jgi:hypothetical protein